MIQTRLVTFDSASRFNTIDSALDQALRLVDMGLDKGDIIVAVDDYTRDIDRAWRVAWIGPFRGVRTIPTPKKTIPNACRKALRRYRELLKENRS